MTIVSEGWNHYQSSPPPCGVLLEFGYFIDRWLWRKLDYHQLDPQQNVCGLYWRWTGIGKEELVAREQPQRPQHWIWYKPANSRTWVERDIYAPEFALEYKHISR